MTYHHGNLKSALLDAGVALVASEGPERLSLRGVARQAGVSQTAPYRHFADKEEMLAAIAQQGALRMREMIHERLAKVEGPVNRLQELGAVYLEFAQGNPHLFRLMFGPLVAKEEEYPKLAETCKDSFEILQGLIREGQASGAFLEGDVEAISLAAWSLVHGFSHLALDGLLAKKDCGQDASALWPFLGSLMVEGLRPRKDD